MAYSRTNTANTDTPKALGFLNLLVEGKKVGVIYVEDEALHSFLSKEENVAKFLTHVEARYNPNIKKETKFSFL